MKTANNFVQKINGKGLEPKAISVVIPTYNRNEVLLDTIALLLALTPAPTEILIIDQTKRHNPITTKELERLEAQKKIRRIMSPYPSIPHAMNMGLKLACHEIVLFLDDDIIPGDKLIKAHLNTHKEKNHNIVAGQVLQLGERIHKDDASMPFRFSSDHPRFVSEVMGGNFSIKRELAIHLGGFDENFIYVAYRFEAEFCERAMRSGEKIFFEPTANIRHLKVQNGGTRSFGRHLTTLKPCHSVGAYYYLLCSKNTPRRLYQFILRPLRAVGTRFHLKHPWWMPVTLISELRGFFLAIKLKWNGPKYIG